MATIRRTGRHDVARTRPQHLQSCSGLALHPGLKSLSFLHHSHHAVARVVACALVRDHVLLRHFASERWNISLQTPLKWNCTIVWAGCFFLRLYWGTPRINSWVKSWVKSVVLSGLLLYPCVGGSGWWPQGLQMPSRTTYCRMATTYLSSWVKIGSRVLTSALTWFCFGVSWIVCVCKLLAIMLLRIMIMIMIMSLYI